jgi:hypothetical protein
VVLVPADLITAEPALAPAASGRETPPPDEGRMAKVTRLTAVPRPRATRPGRERPESAVVPLPAGRTSAVEAPADGDGLPRRVRRRGPVNRPRPVVADTPAPRSPEEVRRAMSALQAGTARGRRDGARAVADPTDLARDRVAEPSPAEPAPAPEPPNATERDA